MKKLYVIGWPIKHSRSPLIHNHWLKKHGFNAKYEQKEINPNNLEKFINTLNKEKCLGFNITIPHKESVYNLVTNRASLSKKLSATNVISWQDNQLYASNTDGYGFYKNLTEQSQWNAFNKPVLIYGAGGAARAIVQSMYDAGAKNIYIYNRTPERAQKLLADLNIKATLLNNEQELSECLTKTGLFINTTSLGMNGATKLDIDLSIMPKNAIIADIVYTPLETDLIKRAKKQGLITVDGLGMLLHQAAKAFEIWFGVLPDVDKTLRDIIIADLKQKGEA